MCFANRFSGKSLSTVKHSALFMLYNKPMKGLLRQSLDALKIITLGLALSVGVSYLFASSVFSYPPTGTIPPANNVDAPINVSGTAQAKLGGLSLGTVSLPTSGALFRLIDGNQANGKVLTSDANGNATWQRGSITIIGPLTGTSTSSHFQGNSFTLSTASNVLIFGYANTVIPNSVASTLSLRLDNVQVSKALISDAAISGGGTASVSTLTYYASNLAAGTHTVQMDIPSPGAFVDSSYNGYGGTPTWDVHQQVKMYVYVLP